MAAGAASSFSLSWQKEDINLAPADRAPSTSPADPQHGNEIVKGKGNRFHFLYAVKGGRDQERPRRTLPQRGAGQQFLSYELPDCGEPSVGSPLHG
jgi:hypothetical protein